MILVHVEVVRNIRTVVVEMLKILDSYIPTIKGLPSADEQRNNIQIQTQAEVENTPAFTFTQKRRKIE